MSETGCECEVVLCCCGCALWCASFHIVLWFLSGVFVCTCVCVCDGSCSCVCGVWCCVCAHGVCEGGCE